MEDVSENVDESKARGPGKSWFAVAGEIFEHPVVGAQVRTPRPADPSQDAWPPLMAWLWLIKEAARQDRSIVINGQSIVLGRGQLSHSQRYLAKRFNWGHKAIREFLARLAKHEMIELNSETVNVCDGPKTGTCKGTAATVISVRNYGVYQPITETKGTAKGTRGAQQGHSRGTKQYTDTGIQLNKTPTQPASVAPTYVSEVPATDGELAGLNGSAEMMIRDVLAWMDRGDRIGAERWLKTTVDAYGQTVTRDSYHKLKTDIATGEIFARPLQAWSTIARRMKAGGRPEPPKSEQLPAWRQQQASREREADEWEQRRYGKKSKDAQ